MLHFKNAHHNMIFGQLLPNKLTNPALLQGFEKVWREDFIPKNVRPLAYSDATIPLTQTRHALGILSLMRLFHAANITKTDHILHVAANTGYGSVVLSYLAQSIVALEEDKDLYTQLSSTLKTLSIAEIKPYHAPLCDGVPQEAPYDLIIIEGAMEIAPLALLKQLNNTGRLLVFEPLQVSEHPALSRAYLYQKIEKTYTKTGLFEAIAPLVRPVSKTPAFQL